jgi:hypothetical protein
MALVNSDHATSSDNSRKFWEDTLKNDYANLFQVQKLIYQLTQDPKKSYSTDTGQNTINVSKQDLPSLLDREKSLKKQIEELEEKLGIIDNSAFLSQAVPTW